MRIFENKSLPLRRLRKNMTAIELLKVNETTLHVMLVNGITPSDVRYIP